MAAFPAPTVAQPTASRQTRRSEAPPLMRLGLSKGLDALMNGKAISHHPAAFSGLFSGNGIFCFKIVPLHPHTLLSMLENSRGA